jgi:hypothetical protein
MKGIKTILFLSLFPLVWGKNNQIKRYPSFIKTELRLSVVVHTVIPASQEVEPGGF